MTKSYNRKRRHDKNEKEKRCCRCNSSGGSYFGGLPKLEKIITWSYCGNREGEKGGSTGCTYGSRFHRPAPRCSRLLPSENQGFSLEPFSDMNSRKTSAKGLQQGIVRVGRGSRQQEGPRDSTREAGHDDVIDTLARLRFSFCALTWTHSDSLQRVNWGRRKGSGQRPLSHTAPSGGEKFRKMRGLERSV